jgi:hypothetical protein
MDEPFGKNFPGWKLEDGRWKKEDGRCKIRHRRLRMEKRG